MQNSISKYSSRTVWIHWLSALLIFGLIATGVKMEHTEQSELKFLLYQFHFLMGIVVFVLTIIRIYVLFNDPKPSNLYPKKSFRERLRKWVYNGFYIVITWMCISGILSIFLEGILPALESRNWVDLPDISADGFHPIMLSHHIIAKLVFLLLIMHILGFIIHLIQKKENTLKRIWF